MCQVVDFAIGQYSMIVLTDTRDVFAFGRNNLGQLGLGEEGEKDDGDKLLPTLVTHPSSSACVSYTLSNDLLLCFLCLFQGQTDFETRRCFPL